MVAMAPLPSREPVSQGISAGTMDVPPSRFLKISLDFSRKCDCCGDRASGV